MTRQRNLNMIFDNRAPSYNEVTTQKARGLALCRNLPYQLFAAGFGDVEFRVWPVNATLGDLPAFARPCPVTPKHGFVESREVKGWSDFEEIKTETLYHDPDGELILMPRLSGKYSGILTPTGMSWGFGHDGATSGQSRNIPCVDSGFSKMVIDSYLLEKAGIKDDSVPYVEIVEHEDSLKAVQMRAGPAQPQSPDFIPRKTQVTHVMQVSDYGDDLIRFDRHLKKLKKEYGEGLAVYAPNASLASHWAVQCMILGVVCMTTRMPQLGETLLQQESTTRRDWSKADYVALSNAIARIMTCDSSQRWAFAHDDEEGLVKLAIGGMHSHANWSPDSHLLNLIAHGITACGVFTVAAGMGEVRHWYHEDSGPGRTRNCPCDYCDCESGCENPDWEDDESPMPTCKISFDPYGRSESRSSVYRRALRLPMSELIREGEHAAEDLNHPGWGEGYGGEGWADGCRAGVDLLKSLVEFCIDPCESTWQTCQTGWNHAINQSHNNGRILNKWVSPNVFDSACFAPSFTFATRAAAKITLDTPAPDTNPDLFLNHGIRKLKEAA